MARWASRPVLVGVGAVFAVLLGFPRLLYRRLSGRLVRDNPGLHGPATLTVTGDGLHTRAANTESRVGWSRYQRYVETKESLIDLKEQRE
jgi:hypothetical protein